VLREALRLLEEHNQARALQIAVAAQVKTSVKCNGFDILDGMFDDQ
jgi:hypothetical protein